MPTRREREFLTAPIDHGYILFGRARMRWSTKQRMAFIAGRLSTAGKINRRDIMEHFEVSPAQAAGDFRTFERENPGAMEYDKSRKAYFLRRALPASPGRDINAAAKRLMYSDEADLNLIMRHDPDMIRDVAAALIYSRSN